MTTIPFGLRTDSIHHPLVDHALKLSRELMNCTGPMSNLVDFVPVLQYFPNRMRIRAEKFYEDLLKTYGGLIKEIELELNSGKVVDDCLVKSMLQFRKEENLDHLDMTILASAFIIGGVETTAAIMQWFTALIRAHPDIPKKAQDELDHVVGRCRLPTIEDEKNLPYRHTIVKEVESCHNPFWLDTPHVASEDVTYKGNFISKDTVVVLNTWTMHHDPKHYFDPDTFEPDRYINDHLASAESATLANPHARHHWMFGAGRRICPGTIISEREIWLTISRLLWAFDMRELPDEPIDLREYDGLFGRSPVPFRIIVSPRHANVKKVFEGWGRELGTTEAE